MVTTKSMIRGGHHLRDPLQSGFPAIAGAYADYAKTSFENGKALVEKAFGREIARMHTEFAKCGSFVGSIAEIHGSIAENRGPLPRFARPFVKSLETIVSKSTATVSH